MKTYSNFGEFWNAVEADRAATKARGGDLYPREIVPQTLECCRLRGVDCRAVEIDGCDKVLITALDPDDGLPIEAHGGPARINR